MLVATPGTGSMVSFKDCKKKTGNLVKRNRCSKTSWAKYYIFLPRIQSRQKTSVVQRT